MRDYQKVLKWLERGPLYLFTLMSGSGIGSKMMVQKEEVYHLGEDRAEFWKAVYEVFDPKLCPYRYSVADREIFAERLVQEPELVICGGGHISLELSALAEFMEFPYTVIDEREEFADRNRFPGAKECICMPFQEVFATRTFSGNAYYIIVTRGHTYDMACLEMILKRFFGYVGMIGSRNKVRKTMEALSQKGFSKEKLSQVHSPIGLDIGGQTPKEIAVSIVAQLIQIKNMELPSGYLHFVMKERIESGKNMVLVKIIGKRGSAPRGIGSSMIVDKSGILAGTIGGGVVEYKAVEQAGKLFDSGGCLVESYRLDTDTAASLGMWCGGELDVWMESC